MDHRRETRVEGVVGDMAGDGDKSNNHRDASESLIFLTLGRVPNFVVGLTTTNPHPPRPAVEFWFYLLAQAPSNLLL